jgi:UDP-glucose 4-epimerase
MRGKKVIVTGGVGFIGSYLVKRLVQDGYKVSVIDSIIRGDKSRISNILNEIDFYEADIRDEDFILKIFKKAKADLVIHLAAVNGTENFYNHPQLVLDVGIRGMLSVINACQKTNVFDLIVASSAEVYQKPDKIPTSEQVSLMIPNSLNPRYSYGGSKIASELIAFNYFKDHFRKVQIFRPHNVYGPNMGWKHVIPQFIVKIKELNSKKNDLELNIQGNGKETRAFCYIDDIIDGIMRIYNYGDHREIYNIGNNKEISILKLIEHLENLMNIKVKIKKSRVQQGSVLRRCPDLSKMLNIGYLPKINIEDGLEKTIEWYLKKSEKKLINKLL